MKEYKFARSQKIVLFLFSILLLQIKIKIWFPKFVKFNFKYILLNLYILHYNIKFTNILVYVSSTVFRSCTISFWTKAKKLLLGGPKRKMLPYQSVVFDVYM